MVRIGKHDDRKRVFIPRDSIFAVSKSWFSIFKWELKQIYYQIQYCLVTFTLKLLFQFIILPPHLPICPPLNTANQQPSLSYRSTHIIPPKWHIWIMKLPHVDAVELAPDCYSYRESTQTHFVNHFLDDNGLHINNSFSSITVRWRYNIPSAYVCKVFACDTIDLETWINP